MLFTDVPTNPLDRFTFVFVCLICVFIKPGLTFTFEKAQNSSPELFQSITQLAENAQSYLIGLIGKRNVTTIKQCLCQVVNLLAEGLSSGLNVISAYLTHFLRAAGVDVDLTFNNITPEEVVYVGQWVFLVLITYWLISLAFQLMASTLKRAVWLLKLGGAVALFGFILSDRSVGTETIGIRLAGLVCLCVLLGVGSSGGGAVSDKTARLEQQVNILERRLREMERWRGTEELRS